MSKADGSSDDRQMDISFTGGSDKRIFFTHISLVVGLPFCCKDIILMLYSEFRLLRDAIGTLLAV